MAMVNSERTYIENAIERARGGYDAALGSAKRDLLRMGINPNSGKYAALTQAAGLKKAAGLAATANDASYNWLQEAQDQYNKDKQLDYQYDALAQARLLKEAEMAFNEDKFIAEQKRDEKEAQAIADGLKENNSEPVSDVAVLSKLMKDTSAKKTYDERKRAQDRFYNSGTRYL